jgi:hypothetical protein
MSEKIMLIAGCSHTAGAEIDGTQDSTYNREASYGNQLAKIMGYRPINIAVSGSTNPGIARSILEWFEKNYNPQNMEVFCTIGWTESSRMEIPSERPHWYNEVNQSADWFPSSHIDYLRINLGWKGAADWEIKIVKYYQEFMANNAEYLEILSANLVLQIQYFLKYQQIKYVMCNTMHMFERTKNLNFYLDQIDSSRYVGFDDNNSAFYWKYKNAGYTNSKAKYWHHNEEPHRLFAEYLQNFITK